VTKVYISRNQQATDRHTRFFPASRCSLRDGAEEEEGACADAMAPRLPPTQPGPNLGEISPSPIRRPPLIRSSPGEGARDLATRSGPGSGLGDLGCALRSFQIRSAPERLGLGRLQSSVASIFFWCVAVESDRFEFPACCWQLLRRGRSLVVVSTVVCGRCPGDASGWDGFAGLGSVCRRSIGAGAAMYHVAPSSKQAGSL